MINLNYISNSQYSKNYIFNLDSLYMKNYGPSYEGLMNLEYVFYNIKKIFRVKKTDEIFMQSGFCYILSNQNYYHD